MVQIFKQSSDPEERGRACTSQREVHGLHSVDLAVWGPSGALELPNVYLPNHEKVAWSAHLQEVPKGSRQHLGGLADMKTKIRPSSYP